MPAQVYVSYAQSDQAYGAALTQHLGARGIAVWADPRGEVFDPIVQQAIDAATAVIVVQTGASMASPAVVQQIEYAASRGKQLVVLLRQESGSPPALAAAHVVDVRDGRLPGDETVWWLHQLGAWQAARQATPAPATRSGRRRTLVWTLTSVGAVAVVALVVVCVVAALNWPFSQSTIDEPRTWQERAAAIPGITVYLDPSSPAYDVVTDRRHLRGVLDYPMTPPAGGPHNDRWQNCMGDVYPAEIAKEHAVHSLEHGTVWITYDPGLPQDQIDALAAKVDGREYLMMSPYPGQPAPISLQAWGYQLTVDDAGDDRIDDFIAALRLNATQEAGATCSGGITDTASVPFDF